MTETMRRLPVTPQPESTIWCSPRLEVGMLKLKAPNFHSLFS